MCKLDIRLTNKRNWEISLNCPASFPYPLSGNTQKGSEKRKYIMSSNLFFMKCLITFAHIASNVVLKARDKSLHKLCTRYPKVTWIFSPCRHPKHTPLFTRDQEVIYACCCRVHSQCQLKVSCVCCPVKLLSNVVSDVHV